MKVIILAAGKGTRLHSEEANIPKALREVCGKPLLRYVLDNIAFIPEEDIYIVVGYKKEMILRAFRGQYHFVEQEEQLGTGHAVMMAEPFLRDYQGDVMVLYGDMPLVSTTTLRNIMDAHQKTSSRCTLLTAVVENPPDYGRIIRDEKGDIMDIVEVKDCTPEQLAIPEVNVGVQLFDAQTLFEGLKLLKNDNKQKEYYLTGVPKILMEKGIKVNSFVTRDADEILGVNTLEDMKMCEAVLSRRQSE